MTDQFTVRAARAPCTFVYGNDFKLWFDQFLNYCDAGKAVQTSTEEATTSNQAQPQGETNRNFKLFLTFLCPKSFQIAQNLGISEDEQKNLKQCYNKLAKALSTDEDQIPARLSLKYRRQKPTESLSNFAYELELLGNRVYTEGESAQKQFYLVDCFCTGLIDTQLSIKLLQENFKTLNEALSAAQNANSAINIRKLIDKQEDNPNTAPHFDILNVDTTTSPNKHTLTTHQTPDTQNNTNIHRQGRDPDSIGTDGRRQEYRQDYRQEQQNFYNQRSANNPQNPNYFPRNSYNQTSANNPQNPNYFSRNTYGTRNTNRTCYFCGRLNHIERFCKVKERIMQLMRVQNTGESSNANTNNPQPSRTNPFNTHTVTESPAPNQQTQDFLQGLGLTQSQ